MVRFLKFCIVGGTGAIIQTIVYYLLSNKFGYVNVNTIGNKFCLMIGIGFAVVWNYSINSLWTFSSSKNFADADYEWNAFFNGNPIQKWWKHEIANTVWKFAPHNSIVLDIGCGTSPIIQQYENAMGIDLNYQKLAFMKVKFPKLQFFHMSADSLQLPNNDIDTTLCIEVIEHMKNPEKVISEMSRVTKVGGTVVIATPDYNRWWWYIAELFTSYRVDHITKFTRRKLETMCSKFDLRPVRHKYIAGCDLVEMFVKE
jgi:SAM-dependent methyltransferase